MKKILVAFAVSSALLGDLYAGSTGLNALRGMAPETATGAAILPAPAFEKVYPEKGSCSIRSLSDAKKCMRKVAQAFPAYEEPNDGLATTNVAGLVKVLKLLGRDSQSIQKAKNADYAGLVVGHGDEHHIYYYALKNGKNTAPVELYDLNVVDMEYLLDAPYSSQALNPATYFLGIPHNDCAYDALSEALGGMKASFYAGRHIASFVGDEQCLVTPDAVTRITSLGKQVTPITPGLDSGELQGYIKAAEYEPLELVAVHVTATSPAVTVSAGILPMTRLFDLYTDGADIRKRNGPGTDKLLEIIRKYCGQF